MTEPRTVVFLDYPRGCTLGAARELGLRTLVVLPLQGSMVGAMCADPDMAHKVVQTELSMDGIVAALGPTGRIVRVVSHLEQLLPLAHEVATALAVPATVDRVECLVDKEHMKAALAQAGLPIARYEVTRSREEAERAAGRLGYPVVVKPARATASRGVIRVDEPAGLAAAIRQARLVALATADDRVLVEEYLPGTEIGVEALVCQGEAHVALVSDKPIPLTGPYFEESIYLAPTQLPTKTVAAVESITRCAVAALRIRRGPVHLEFRVDGDTCHVLEVTGRPGSPPRYVSAALGTSYERATLACLLDDLTCWLPPEVITPAGYLILPVRRSGRLRKVLGLAGAEAIPEITGIALWKRPGDRLVEPPAFNGYLGTVHAVGDSAERVYRTLRKVLDTVEVMVE